METSGLLSICFSAIIAVFFILTLLAVLMRIIIKIFPDKESSDDAGLYAAIATAYSSIYQGSKISKIEELK